MIHRVNNGREYYVFPGGGQEDKETTEETAVRELREEASVEVKINKLQYHVQVIMDVTNFDHYFYLCDYISGQPKLSQRSNEAKEMKTSVDFYEPVWFPVSKLSGTLIYLLEIRDWLVEDLRNGFPDKPRETTFKHSELRQ